MWHAATLANAAARTSSAAAFSAAEAWWSGTARIFVTASYLQIARRALACVELGRLEDAEVDLNALVVGHAGQARDAAVLALKKRIAVLRKEADKQSVFKSIFTPD